ncbi:MAG TPA: DUF4321 domain-containing protein [Candidatus Polarisedimenticolia bacterium]|nr:DUF4321 domain-containing protein [Candidatus Polarisedimenticolia bacterium]
MPRGGLRFWHLLVIVLLAAMLGTAVGDILGKAFPDGAIGRIASAAVRIGTSDPWDLDLRVAQVTFGLMIRLTLLGGVGACVALVVFFRRI